MCRAHDIETSNDGRAWRSPVRTPLYYPDAVTLVPGLDAEEVLAGIDASPGCSVKDSYADVDLSGHGFEVLFEAEWIARSPETPLPAGDAFEWGAATDLAAWETAWSGGETTGLFKPRLLDDPSVLIIEGRDDAGAIAAGAVLSRNGDVAGVSNVFGGGLAGTIRTAADLLGAGSLVGYESGEDLDAALALGFRSLGRLRVWLRA